MLPDAVARIRAIRSPRPLALAPTRRWTRRSGPTARRPLAGQQPMQHHSSQLEPHEVLEGEQVPAPRHVEEHQTCVPNARSPGLPLSFATRPSATNAGATVPIHSNAVAKPEPDGNAAAPPKAVHVTAYVSRKKRITASTFCRRRAAEARQVRRCARITASTPLPAAARGRSSATTISHSLASRASTAASTETCT